MPENLQHLVMWLIPLAPLAAAIVTALLGPQGLREKSHLPCWFGLAVAVVCAYVLLFSIVPAGFSEHGSTAIVAPGYQWIDVGGMDVRMDLRADAMTAIDALDGYGRQLACVGLCGRLHARRPRLSAVLCLLLAVRVFDVHAGAVFAAS